MLRLLSIVSVLATAPAVPAAQSSLNLDLEGVRGFHVVLRYRVENRRGRDQRVHQLELQQYVRTQLRDLGLLQSSEPAPEHLFPALRVEVDLFDLKESGHFVRVEMTVVQPASLIRRPDLVLDVPTWSRTSSSLTHVRDPLREIRLTLRVQLEELASDFAEVNRTVAARDR